VSAFLLIVLGSATVALPAAADSSARESRGLAYYHFLLGALSADEGNVERALSELGEAARLDQTAPEIRVELSDVYLRSGDTDKALLHARDAVSHGGGDVEAHRSLAEALAATALRSEVNRERLAEAIAEYRKVVELGGGDPDTLTVLGKLQLQGEAPDDAADSFRLALAKGADVAQTHLLLGRALLRAGRKDEAAEHYAAVLERVPRQVEALSNLAILQEEAEKWPEAARTYGDLAAVRPSEPTILFHQGVCLLRAGKAEEAVAPLKTATEMAPANTGASRALALALRQSGHPAEALQRYNDLLEASPDDFYLLYEIAGLREGREEGAEAAELLERALAVAEKDPSLKALAVPVALRLASLQLERKQPAKALSAVERAEGLGGGERAETALLRCHALLLSGDIAGAAKNSAEAQERFPGDVRFRLIDAEAAAAQGDFHAAEKKLAEAIGQAGTTPEVSLRAAQIWSRRGETERALAVLEQASRRMPEDDSILLEWGGTLEKAGRIDHAAAILRRAIAANEKNHAALNYLGYMFADQGSNLEEAQRLIEKALALSPGNGAYLDSLGWVLFKRGRAGEALDPLSRAAELLAGDATVKEHLGDVLAAVGRRTEAETKYREAIELGGPRKRIEGKIRHAEEGK